mgnify:CR=1 FL=1
MAGVIPDRAKAMILAMLLKQVPPEPLVLRLFINDREPHLDDTAARYLEPEGSGYAAIPLRGAEWTIDEGPPVRAEHTGATFKFTGYVGDVWGYYVAQASGRMLWAERFERGPYRVLNWGDEIQVTPGITLQ